MHSESIRLQKQALRKGKAELARGLNEANIQ